MILMKCVFTLPFIYIYCIYFLFLSSNLIISTGEVQSDLKVVLIKVEILEVREEHVIESMSIFRSKIRKL